MFDKYYKKKKKYWLNRNTVADTQLHIIMHRSYYVIFVVRNHLYIQNESNEIHKQRIFQFTFFLLSCCRFRCRLASSLQAMNDHQYLHTTTLSSRLMCGRIVRGASSFHRYMYLYVYIFNRIHILNRCYQLPVAKFLTHFISERNERNNNKKQKKYQCCVCYLEALENSNEGKHNTHSILNIAPTEQSAHTRQRDNSTDIKHICCVLLFTIKYSEQFTH